jgi:hypothetical protein
MEKTPADPAHKPTTQMIGKIEFSKHHQGKLPPLTLRSSPLYRSTYQDYNLIVGYASTTYNSAKDQATVTVKTQVNPREFSSPKLEFIFNNEAPSSSNQFTTSADKFKGTPPN